MKPLPLALACLLTLPGCAGAPANERETKVAAEQAERAEAKARAEIETAWKAIVAWYGAEAPDGALKVAPPATAAQLAAAERSIGRPLPAGLRAWFQLANGTERTSVHEVFYLATLDELCEERTFMEGLKESAWGHGQGWIPFAANGGGDFICLDAEGRVFTFCHETGREGQGGPTLTAWLKQFASELESGAWVYSKEDQNLVRAE